MKALLEKYGSKEFLITIGTVLGFLLDNNIISAESAIYKYVAIVVVVLGYITGRTFQKLGESKANAIVTASGAKPVNP